MTLAELCGHLHTAEAASYGHQISTAAHTRIVMRLRQTSANKALFPRRFAMVAAAGLAVLVTLHASPVRASRPRFSDVATSGFDAGAGCDGLFVGDGGDHVRTPSADAPGGPSALP